jgi:hypothetical protein
MTIKKSKWRSSLKVLPKTLSESCVAECGHTFSYRIPLRNFAGLEASESNWAQLEKIFEKERKTRSLYSCPECTAKVDLDTCRASQKILFNFLQVKPLPLLEGTTRQLAYAENVRYSFVSEPLRMIQRSLCLSENFVVSKLLFYSVEKLGESYGIVPTDEAFRFDSSSQDLILLRSNFEKAQMENIFNPIKNPDYVLAFWLVARKFWETELKYIGWQDNTKTWIARNSRTPKSFRMATTTSAQRFLENHWYDLIAAIFVAQAASWETISQAENAYNFLTQQDPIDGYANILTKVLENNSCSTWNEVFDMTSVWTTLAK